MPKPLPRAKHWLVKQEPESYAWSAFEHDQRTAWTGIRSYPARLHLRRMKMGDLVLYYHSGEVREVVGLARVVREAYPDPTAAPGDGDWSCVDLVAVKPLRKPVPLAAFKGDATLREAVLVKQSRLSVMPLTAPQFVRVLRLAETTVR